MSSSQSAGAEGRDRTEEANAEALRRIVSAEPLLVDLKPAGEVIPGLGEHDFLHAGPPLTGWEEVEGALRGSVLGSLIHLGFARDVTEAESLAASGEIHLVSANDCHTGGDLRRSHRSWHSGVRCGKSSRWHPRLLGNQRGSWSGPPVRVQRRRNSGASGMARRRVRRDSRSRHPPLRRHRPLRNPRPGSAYGRRWTQPAEGSIDSFHEHHRPLRRGSGFRGKRNCARSSVPRPERYLLPPSDHGVRQVDDGIDSRNPRVHGGLMHGSQRSPLRHQGQRPG